jgi:hypothetical protein
MFFFIFHYTGAHTAKLSAQKKFTFLSLARNAARFKRYTTWQWKEMKKLVVQSLFKFQAYRLILEIALLYRGYMKVIFCVFFLFFILNKLYSSSSTSQTFLAKRKF